MKPSNGIVCYPVGRFSIIRLLDINGAITMVTIFEANKSVTNMDQKKKKTKNPPKPHPKSKFSYFTKNVTEKSKKLQTHRLLFCVGNTCFQLVSSFLCNVKLPFRVRVRFILLHKGRKAFSETEICGMHTLLKI